MALSKRERERRRMIINAFFGGNPQGNVDQLIKDTESMSEKEFNQQFNPEKQKQQQPTPADPATQPQPGQQPTPASRIHPNRQGQTQNEMLNSMFAPPPQGMRPSSGAPQPPSPGGPMQGPPPGPPGQGGPAPGQGGPPPGPQIPQQGQPKNPPMPDLGAQYDQWRAQQLQPQDQQQALALELQNMLDRGEISQQEYAEAFQGMVGQVQPQPPTEEEIRNQRRVETAFEEDWAVGINDFEHATRHKKISDPNQNMIVDSLADMRRGFSRRRYNTPKTPQEYKLEISRLVGEYSEYDKRMAYLRQNYKRMDTVARMQFDKLEEKTNALNQVLDNGNINNLEYYRSTALLNRLAEQYHWDMHFVAPGAQPGDVVVQDGIIKQNVDGQKFEVRGYTPEYIEANKLEVNGKTLIPDPKKGYIEVDPETGMTHEEMNKARSELTKEIEEQMKTRQQAWEESLQQDVMGNVVDENGNPIPQAELQEKMNPMYWLEQATKDVVQHRQRMNSLLQFDEQPEDQGQVPQPQPGQQPQPQPQEQPMDPVQAIEFEYQERMANRPPGEPPSFEEIQDLGQSISATAAQNNLDQKDVIRAVVEHGHDKVNFALNLAEAMKLKYPDIKSPEEMDPADQNRMNAVMEVLKSIKGK